jgi:hypothetical protein
VDVIISSEAVKRSGRAGVFMLARWWRCSRSSSLNSWGTGNRLLGEGDGGAGVVLAGSWSIRHDLIDIMSIIGDAVKLDASTTRPVRSVKLQSAS